jgi:hypothetical protein
MTKEDDGASHEPSTRFDTHRPSEPLVMGIRSHVSDQPDTVAELGPAGNLIDRPAEVGIPRHRHHMREATMAKYYVNKNAQPTGEHEVHENGCKRMPDAENRTYLGDFTNCDDAVTAAKVHYKKVDGCEKCSEKCHTT